MLKRLITISFILPEGEQGILMLVFFLGYLWWR